MSQKYTADQEEGIIAEKGRTETWRAKEFTGHKGADERLKESEEQFRSVAQSANDAIISADSRGKIIFWNKGAEIIFDYKEEEVLGKPLIILMPERYRDSHQGGLKNFPLTGKTKAIGKITELHGLRKNGTEFPLELSLAVWSSRGETFYSGIIRDITERKRAEEMIQYLAYYDVLTRLPNRTLLHDYLQQAIFTARDENKPFALLVMDLNRFKEINNTLGHHNGDLLLQQVGGRLRNILRETDTIARLGGDEFAVIIPDTDAEKATQTAGMIIKGFNEPFVFEGLQLDISASIGIALFPGHGEETHTLIRRADIAMHTAKKIESGWIIFSPKYDQFPPDRLALMGELRHAIEQDQLFLLYQPKLDLKANGISGIEALVRWQHPKLGIIPPNQFIEVAEKTGLINQLTLWVLKEAVRQSRILCQSGFETSVAVNLSVKSLQTPQLLDLVKGLLSTWGVSPDLLRLEITESIIMADPDRAMEIITQLVTMGIRFSIDDFGTGYSSLGYLQRLPVDEIKIDKSFVMNMMVDKNSMKIVRSIIELTHSLGLKVTAEGVENKEALDRLNLLGCDAAQGYFISPPIPQTELAGWLKKIPFSQSCSASSASDGG